MAGTSLILKENQVLFREGDAADGMYLIRRGELCVYLEKNGSEVRLASIGTGGMIGEMAFFDKKPRSASVKALPETEVTKITEQDFAKLMKQIPKWFVSIMTSLSTRLRETNERLQKLEAKAMGAKAPYEDVTKILQVLILIWHKEGVKDGKSWSLNRTTAEKAVADIFASDALWTKNFFDALINQKFFNVTLDNYKNQLLSTANKAALQNLSDFIRRFVKENPTQKSLPKEGIEMLETLHALAKTAPYDTLTVPLKDLMTEGERNALVTASWKNDLAFFKNPSEALTITKVSDGLGIKVNRVELPKLIENHRVLSALAKAGVA